MAHSYFGDRELCKKIEDQLPIPAEQIEANGRDVRIWINSKTADKFNGYNRFAVGAEATAQIWKMRRPGYKSPLIKELYKIASFVDVDQPADSLYCYTIKLRK